MIDLQQLIVSHLPARRRTSSQGWIMFNAQCCHHRGHRPDTRMRGNIMFGSDGQIGGNCYNCGFKFKFDGNSLSDSFAQWLGWIGVDAKEIQSIKIGLLAKSIAGEGGSAHTHQPAPLQWPTVDLPEAARPIDELAEEGCTDPDFLSVCNYLLTRGEDLAQGYPYQWSASSRNLLNTRLIIPFFCLGRIVGWTARYAGTPPAGVPRYWNSSIPPGYLFNQDVLQLERQFVLVLEGPFDAIAVQGVSPLGSTMSDLQIQNLLNSNQHPIVLPDRQRKNQGLIDAALAFGWSVSFPEWEDHIKDAADACRAYGQIYTITSALAARTNNPIEIGVKRKMFRG